MSIRYGQKSPYVLRRYGPVKSRCLSVILDHDQIFLLQLHHVTSCHSTLSLKKVQFNKSQQHHDTTKKSNNAVRDKARVAETKPNPKAPGIPISQTSVLIV